MRTLVLSDLHLGGRGGIDILARSRPRAALCERLDGVDRLVLLGDVVELRHGPVHQALDAAEPVLRALGDALAPSAEVVLVAGNHDHATVAPWLVARTLAAPPAPLRLEERPGPRASALTERMAQWLGASRTDVAYPGLWLREDVYATHGHYLDRLTTMPTFERLAAGAMNRVVGRVPARGAVPDDFEAGLGPIYAWLGDVANQPAGAGWSASRQNSSAKAWVALSGNGRRPVGARALGALMPAGVFALNRLGLGPVRADFSGAALRRASLVALSAALVALEVRAPYVVFGHTHRAGPLPGDDLREWRVAPTGTQLVNGGSWVDDPVFATGGPDNPYWPGRAVVLDDDGPPRVERVIAERPDAGGR